MTFTGVIGVEVRPPSDAEVAELIDSYGVPVRLVTGSGSLLLGWLDDDDRDDPMAGLLALLRQAVEAIESGRK